MTLVEEEEEEEEDEPKRGTEPNGFDDEAAPYGVCGTDMIEDVSLSDAVDCLIM